MPSNAEQRKRYALSLNGRARKLLHRAKTRCGKDNVSITFEWVMEKLNKGICEITNIPFDLSATDKYTINPYAPSLDRIDPKNKQYSPENTRVILASVNTSLNQYGEQTMLPILKAMIIAIENKNTC